VTYLIALSLLVAALTPHQQSGTQPPRASEINSSDMEENVPDDEVAPAALHLDVGKSSPLIQALYQATRETKEQATLEQLAKAKKLIEEGADVKAADAQGRTALHWAIFGSSYTMKPKIQVAYEEIASDLIDRNVEINREDIYNDTALDYLLYSPNEEMQTLLIEHAATSGFLAAVLPFGEVSASRPESSATPASQKNRPVLKAGHTISIRLSGPAYSDKSRTGDPIEGTVTYPLCTGGEFVECKEDELVLPPGTKVNGTILFAQKAPDKYSRPRLVLDFSNVVHRSGETSRLYARVLDVDNARETVRNNEILGIVQPHASTKTSVAMAAVGAVHPAAGYTIRGIQAVYGLSIRREILFPAGTDLQVQVVRPSILKQREAWDGWKKLDVDANLKGLVEKAPVRTHTSDGTLSDVTNLVFLGTEQQLVSAFTESGWFAAETVNFGSAAKTIGATIRQSGYSKAPVSMLRINGRPPDLVFQKSLDTFAKRHHVRIWKQPGTYSGSEIWVGAGTHDIAITNARVHTKWSHRIDPHIDRERDWIATDLLFSGTAVAYADVDRPGAPHKTTNATGDQIQTDGKMSVLSVNRSKGSFVPRETAAESPMPRQF
jgi:hypothetical protein